MKRLLAARRPVCAVKLFWGREADVTGVQPAILSEMRFMKFVEDDPRYAGTGDWHQKLMLIMRSWNT